MLIHTFTDEKKNAKKNIRHRLKLYILPRENQHEKYPSKENIVKLRLPFSFPPLSAGNLSYSSYYTAL